MPLTLGLAAMATRFELVLEDGDPVAARAAGEAALAEIAEVERRLSRFRPDALPAQLERAGGGAGVVVARDELVLLELCRRAGARSGRAFDPALEGAPLASWRVERRGRRVFPPANAARLDFGGVGKGHALDRAVRVLEEAGVERALLHGGTSSIAALGSPAAARDAPTGWRIALRDPLQRERILATVVLRDASLSVSAPRSRVIDPRDGTPLQRVRLAAALARRGAVAEIASTALLVLAERALRRGERPEAASLAAPFTPSLSALVAWEERGELRSLRFGPRADLFTAAPRARALMETCR